MSANLNAQTDLPELLYIDGRWVEGHSTTRHPVLEAATGEVLGQVTFAGEADVDAACCAAQAAFAGWSALPAAERGRFLAGIAKGLRARKSLLAAAIAQNNGKPLVEAQGDVEDAASCYAYYAELASTQALFETLPNPPEGLSVSKRHVALGVAALLVPWNFPLTTAAWKVAPALAAGCTIVLKPSELTPKTELILGVIADEIGLPAGVINIVVGGAECGSALVKHPLVAKVSFTGSNAVGRLILRDAADRFVPVTVELGGKSPIVVFDDYDLDAAVEIVAAGIFGNCGQVCSANSRLIVHATIAEEFRARLKSRAEALVLGDPLAPATTMGPLASSTQFKKVMAYLDLAKAEGLETATGGQAADRVGNYIQPTIYWNVPITSALWREEIFGPVLCARTFTDSEEAIALANDTQYGLAASVLSSDVDRAVAVASRIKAGNVWINGHQNVFPQGSWGGFHFSGFGRELGPEAVLEYTGLSQTTLTLA